MYRFDPGTTSVSLYFRLRDSSTGLAKTGLTSASGGAVASYTRERGSATPITLSALASPTASWSSGGFIQVDSTNAPGLYRLDVPNAAFSAGVNFTLVSLTFTGVIEETVLVRLESSDSNLGAGSIEVPITVTNSVTSQPVSNAEVWVTTDSAGTNVVAGTVVTNNLGVATVFLDAGTYYLWITEPGYTRSNPTTITVS